MNLSVKVFLKISTMLVLFSSTAEAKYCRLSSWVNRALPSGGINCTTASFATSSQQACSSWCQSAGVSFQNQITSNGPVQKPLICDYNPSTTLNCSNSLVSPYETSGFTSEVVANVITDPGKCSTGLSLANIDLARVGINSSSSQDEITYLLARRMTRAWALNNCVNPSTGVSEPNFGYFLDLRLTQTKLNKRMISLREALSLADPHSSTDEANAVILSNANTPSANGYMNCLYNYMNTSPNSLFGGPGSGNNAGCVEPIKSAFSKASSYRQSFTAYAMVISNKLFYFYQLASAHDILDLMEGPGYVTLQASLVRSDFLDDRALTNCTFPRESAAGSTPSGCSYFTQIKGDFRPILLPAEVQEPGAIEQSSR